MKGSEETYGPRTPRAEVAQHIIECWSMPPKIIGNFEDGDNTITANAVKAALHASFYAREHGLNITDLTSLANNICLSVLKCRKT